MEELIDQIICLYERQTIALETLGKAFSAPSIQTNVRSVWLTLEDLQIRNLLLTKIQDIKFSIRAINCMKAAGITCLADLVSYSRNELMKFRNFGKKSLNEIDAYVERLKLDFGLDFGMDVTKYGIIPNRQEIL